jgi:hypothetical protein
MRKNNKQNWRFFFGDETAKSCYFLLKNSFKLNGLVYLYLRLAFCRK